MRDEVGPGVTVVVATKYVTVDELAALAEAGVEVVGENRAQDLAAKHEIYGDAFTLALHRAPPEPEGEDRERDSASSATRSTPSRPRRKLTIPALVEVNLSGEATKSGVAPEELAAFLELYPTCAG